MKKIEKDCEGGMALSIHNIKDRVNDAIKKKYAKHRKLHLLNDLPESALNKYASVIKIRIYFHFFPK